MLTRMGTDCLRAYPESDNGFKRHVVGEICWVYFIWSVKEFVGSQLHSNLEKLSAYQIDSQLLSDV